MTNVVAVVFAHNEEVPLDTTLYFLNKFKQEGRIQNIVVVNDGSTDHTEEVARRAGAIVINHKENLGKREGFVSGANEVKKLGGEVMLTLDADIKRFPRETLHQMINSVASGEKLMSIAQQHEIYALDELSEQSRVKDIHSNAQRAINMKALEPLFRGNEKWVEVMHTKEHKKTPGLIEGEYRWGLEYALDRLIPPNKIVKLSAIVATSHAYRERNSKLQQKGARSIVRSVLDARTERAQQIRAKRAKRELTEFRRIRK